MMMVTEVVTVNDIVDINIVVVAVITIIIIATINVCAVPQTCRRTLQLNCGYPSVNCGMAQASAASG